MVSVILKIVLGEKIILAKKKKFILNTPIFGQYCGITLPSKQKLGLTKLQIEVKTYDMWLDW